jgi:DNA-directed RNA polymerase specialized sigma24 family protein
LSALSATGVSGTNIIRPERFSFTQVTKALRTMVSSHTRKFPPIDSQTLGRLMEQLPAQYREVLLLREVEDLAYKEIAEVTGVPIGTVMSRLARARLSLRKRWLAQAETEDAHGV